jgi:hypothetical protein
MLSDEVNVKYDSSPDSSYENVKLSDQSIIEPDRDLINQYIKRIGESKALNEKLNDLQIKVEIIGYLISVSTLREERYRTARKSRLDIRTKVRDGIKKIKQRNPVGIQPKRRGKLLKSYTLQLARRLITKDTPAGKLNTKHNPYLGDLLVLMNAYIKKKTDEPFKIMAALSILFNLRPEKKECEECKRMDHKTGYCNIKNVFRAPCFENERHALCQMTKRAQSRFPSDLKQRLFLPENQI